MASLRRLLLRILSAIRPDRAEDDLAREVASHLALLEEQFRSAGMEPNEARLAARRAFGGVEQVKEHQRDARSFRWIDDLRQDVIYGVRSFARSPGFTLAAGLTLALGIGAATTIFAAVNAVGLRPLDYQDPDRLVRVFEYQQPRDAAAAPRRANPFAPVHLSTVRQATTLSMVGLQIPRLMLMTIGDAPSRIGGSRVSSAVFPMLGVQPLLGRGLEPGDEQQGSDNVVVISHSLWRQHFAGRAQAISETLTLDGRLHHVVGVMPDGFQFPPGSTGEFWTPLVTAGTGPTFRLSFYARLRDGVSLAAAQQEIASIYDSLRSTTSANRPRLEVAPVKDVLIEPFAPAMTVLVIAVVLVLLIACVNVANLMLARSTVRQYEMALRAALGANRARLLRQHLAEGALLALFAGAGGLVIAAICTSWLRSFGAAGPRRDILPGLNIPRMSDIHVDATVVAFTLTISVLAGLALGLIGGARRPARLSERLRRETGRWPLFGTRGIQHALVIAQVAMAMVLFVGSALMVRSFINLSTIDIGFASRGLTTFQVSLPPSTSVGDLTRFGDELVTRIASLPSVNGAAYAESLPMLPVGRFAVLSKTPSLPKPDLTSPPRLDVRIVSHDYLTVMGTRIVDGRGLSEQDDEGRPRVILINEALKRELYPDGAAVGERLFIGGGVTFDVVLDSGEPWEIVGVVADVRQRTVAEPATPQIFLDQRQLPGPTGGSSINVVVRMNGDSRPLVSSLRPIVAQIEPLAFVDNVATMDQIVGNQYARPRLYALALGVYAVVAVGLAAIGIYGVIAFTVVQRTREIGIRMALGARHRQVQGLVVRDTALVTGAGLLVGLGGAVWSSRLFEGLLFGVTPLDSGTYATVAVAFGFIAMIAALIPARTATSVDPVTALRVE